jgi:hypothetical protein
MTFSDSTKLPVLGQDPPARPRPPEIEGWTERNTTDEPRLSELVELYEELGFEVMVRPVAVDDLAETCSVCVMAEPERYKTIYTRTRRRNYD